MRVQLNQAILLAWMVCSPLCAQRFFAEPSLISMGPMRNRVERNYPLTENALGSCKTSSAPGGREERVKICLAPLSILDVLATSYDGQPFHGVPVAQLPGTRAFFFVSGMTIDADGAPNAYHPNDDGLDEVANAGQPGRWNGIVADQNGTPLLQQKDDPFPGYYISCTALYDRTKKSTDPTTYVDSSTIPYVALPKELADREGMRLGDFGFIMNLNNRRWSYAIYADIGTVGEGSIALADALGISSDARQGGQSDGVFYLLFPDSGNQQPHPIAEIQNAGEKLMSLLDAITETPNSARRMRFAALNTD